MHEVRPGIFLVSVDGRGSIRDALRAGARALLPQSATDDEIESAARAAATGFVAVHPAVARALAGGAAAPRAEASVDTTPRAVERLTRREVEVLNLLADGLGNKQIAGRLGISDHTVKAHVGAIFEKLDVSTRTEAVTRGARLGVVVL